MIRNLGHAVFADYRNYGSLNGLSKLSTSCLLRKRENSSAPWSSFWIANMLSTFRNSQRTNSPVAAVYSCSSALPINSPSWRACTSDSRGPRQSAPPTKTRFPGARDELTQKGG